MHLIDCKLEDLLKIAPTFQKTFDSPKTFSWVELCMALQPDSALRLLVGVDEVRDRFYGSRQDPGPRQEASSQFLVSWCIAMSGIFEEYGAILTRRPWEVYFIDLCNKFDGDPSLRKLWQAYGVTPLRKKDLHFHGYRAARPPQKRPKPHLQLQKSLEVGDPDLHSVFLVHDEDRGIYIWGETRIKGGSHCISVQHEKTGQRLPPAEDFNVESNQEGQLVDHKLSPNGRYLALIYCTDLWSNLASDFRGLTVIWQINENVSFKRRMNCESWARVIFSHASTTTWPLHGSRAVMFKDDRHCLTPSGMVDLLTGSRRPLPDGALGLVGSPVGIFFGCSGEYLFAYSLFTYGSSESKAFQARRLDPFDSSHFVDFWWEDKRRRLVDVSPTGRYLVLGPANRISTTFPQEIVLCLYDTNSNKTVELRLPEPLDYFDGKFHFSRHETRLIAFLLGGVAMNVLIWDCLAIAPKLTSHANWCSTSSILPVDIHVHKAATSAVMVNGTRSIQRIELGAEIKFLDTKNLIDDYPHRLSTISKDCSHWALVSYGQKGGKVQVMDLTSPDAPAHYFDLEWSHSDISRVLSQGTNLPIALSPDLCVLIINAEVFDITITEGNDPPEDLTRTPFTLEALPALLEPHRHQNPFRGLKCQISSCNSFVLYVGDGDQWGNRSRYSSAIFVYRIDLEKRTSARLDLNLPACLVSLHASLHPSLPLMAISYASPTVSELEIISQRPPLLQLAIFDLKSLEMTILEVPKGQLIEAIAK